MGGASGDTVPAVPHPTEALFPFQALWSLYRSGFGQALTSTFGHYGVAETRMIELGANLWVDAHSEIILKDKVPIGLSRIEFRLLLKLIENLGHPVSSDQLIKFVLGDNSFISKDELYVYINRLRYRLEENRKKPKILVTVRKLGYVLYPQMKNLLQSMFIYSPITPTPFELNI
jgi:hypothetical protein